MWPLSAAAQTQLAGSHTIALRATATTRRHGRIEVPISGGSVTVDASAQVRRNATLQVANPHLWPEDPLGVLSPNGAEMLLEYGIVLPAGQTEWVPLITGVLTEASRSTPASSEAITLRLADRTQRVQDARLLSPRQLSGGRVVDRIRELLTEAIPGVELIDRTGSTRTVANMEIERDRWADGIVKLADSIGADLAPDPLGRFVLRPVTTLATRPDWIVREGQHGVLISTSDERTREKAYNIVHAEGHNEEGETVVSATARDEDPRSPTWIGGDFGSKPRFYASQLLTTTQQCQDTADSLLAKVTGLISTIELTTMVNPALDAGDVIQLHRDRTSAHILDSFSVPLSPTQTQKLGTRSAELPQGT